MKEKHNITLKDELNLKKQLNLLIREKKAGSPKHEKQVAQVQGQMIVRNLTKQETAYFGKLARKRKRMFTVIK